MLSVTYAKCQLLTPYAECHYAECRYADCRGALICDFMTKFTLLSWGLYHKPLSI
jgi:hypothetical protein